MKIKSEWGRLNRVIMHRPGTEITYAMLAPKPFLFERPFNYSIAKREHENLQTVLEENGVHVDILEDLIVNGAEKNSSFRRKLEEKILSLVNFYGTSESMENARKDMEKNIGYVDSLSLFQALIMEPSIDLKEYVAGIQYPRVYSNLPLANLYFMRDQQAVSSGVLIGNMKMQQRKKETDITSFVFREILDAKIKRINSGFFEGGDFMPAGDFCLIGTGNRTNEAGAEEAMNSGIFDFDRIVIISNPIYSFMDGHDIMVNMHLDTYFNIPAAGTVITSVELAKSAQARVYVRNSGNTYTEDSKTTLYQFMKDEGYNFIDLGISEQLSYSSNFLTVSDGKIIAIDSSRVIEKLLAENVFDSSTRDRIIKDIQLRKGKMFPDSREIRESGVDVIKIDLSEITGGYGGAHCMTSTIERT
ncbi:arginine deiminase family protein [Ferroplasma sp.]|uniref:arginine deiminase family protein n=1 Tax=Ferroplasma sp. TaxID=2591003 RepID=UPI00261EB303|nr:arginine deiminase family protein [Ferroplasma sp.]MCL4453133.1 arginine deiminase family protein [Candidatus Thermoplasmatota archaeon]